MIKKLVVLAVSVLLCCPARASSVYVSDSDKLSAGVERLAFGAAVVGLGGAFLYGSMSHSVERRRVTWSGAFLAVCGAVSIGRGCYIVGEGCDTLKGLKIVVKF